MLAARHSGQMLCGSSGEGSSRPQLMQFGINEYCTGVQETEEHLTETRKSF
jgi:hypothetical protein